MRSGEDGREGLTAPGCDVVLEEAKGVGVAGAVETVLLAGEHLVHFAASLVPVPGVVCLVAGVADDAGDNMSLGRGVLELEDAEVPLERPL